MATATSSPTSTADAWWTGRPAVRYTRWMPHGLHPPQQAFLWLDCEEALYGGAARGGKTDALLMAALQYVDIPGYSAIIMRRISPDLHGADGIVPRSKEWLAGTLGMSAWNGDRLRWTFPSGATLHFGHMQYEDDKQKFQGHAFQFVGFDELTHFTESQYRYLFSRLTRPSEGPLSKVPMRMRAASNPGGPGHDWVKRRFIDKQTDPNDFEDTPEKARERIFIPAKVRDNPSIDREAYKRSLGYLEPELREQLLEGNWDVRPPGEWYFDDRDLTAVAGTGRDYENALMSDAMVVPYGGLLHLGIDWGENKHCVLGWPLENGGWFIAREYVGTGDEPSDATPRMIALGEWDIPWGKAYFDAAGVQSQKTFNATAERLFGPHRPHSQSVPFGAMAPRTGPSARKSFKGVSAAHLRRLATRTHGVWVKDGMTVVEHTDGAVFVPGPLPGHLAISPRCPELLRQLKTLERNAEDPTGAWLKDDGQHGADAAVALVAHAAIRHRVATAPKVPA